ncbi:MAG: YdcF family protein [Scytonematopsis contorta HA4267-MV1]|jgi:vancomycin permeability regulator SanA|nr:YdcF family protein [Scytonematopsis contorta HA4267-MV1]
MLRKWLSLYWRQLLGLLIFSATITPIALNVYVNFTTNNQRFTEPGKIPPHRVAIVFGAGVRENGIPSPMLADRVTAAVELYKLGRVQKLLMTGDNSRPDYDEVTAMERFAAEKGVPKKDITLDYAGFSTYESCYRAKEIFGVKKAVLISQKFHLPRAVYICEQLGVESVGLGTPDWETYSQKTIGFYSFREFFSTINALLEVHITRPKPTFLGPFEGIQ